MLKMITADLLTIVEASFKMLFNIIKISAVISNFLFLL